MLCRSLRCESHRRRQVERLQTLREGPSYGYKLQGELSLNRGTVYVHPKELREAGMIEVDEVEDDKKYYGLTEDGRQLLNAPGE